MTEQIPPSGRGFPERPYIEVVSNGVGPEEFGPGGFSSAGFSTAGLRAAGFAAGGPGRVTSESMLRRYLLTRAIGRSVVQTVLASGILILVIAAACWLSGLKVLGVLIGLVAIIVLLVRALLVRVERRLSGSQQLGAIEPRVSKLVSRTGEGLRQELHRVGLPAAPWAPLLIVLRLIRPLRRAETVRALGRIELARVVPASQVDELHLLLQAGRS